MPRTLRPIRLAELATLLGCPVEGDESFEISGFASLGQAKPDELVFLRDAAHLPALRLSQARALVVPSGVDVEGRTADAPRRADYYDPDHGIPIVWA